MYQQHPHSAERVLRLGCSFHHQCRSGKSQHMFHECHQSENKRRMLIFPLLFNISKCPGKCGRTSVGEKCCPQFQCAALLELTQGRLSEDLYDGHSRSRFILVRGQQRVSHTETRGRSPKDSPRRDPVSFSPLLLTPALWNKHCQRQSSPPLPIPGITTGVYFQRIMSHAEYQENKGQLIATGRIRASKMIVLGSSFAFIVQPYRQLLC